MIETWELKRLISRCRRWQERREMINYDPHRIKKPLRLDTLPEVIDALEELLVLKEERNDPAILAGNGS